MNKIQTLKPVRRDIAAREDYREYRADLVIDFNGCCGYCDDSDRFADSSCFHIDHFAPSSIFPALKTTYSNLVYSCRYCNVHKSNHWVGTDPALPNDGTKGLIDPCTTDYDTHIIRLPTGEIVGATDLGKYVVRRLHLHLIRHQYLWQSRRLRDLRDQARTLIRRMEANGDTTARRYTELLKSYLELNEKMERYEQLAAN